MEGGGDGLEASQELIKTGMSLAVCYTVRECLEASTDIKIKRVSHIRIYFFIINMHVATRNGHVF